MNTHSSVSSLEIGPNVHPRVASVANTFSLLMPGLGHVYCGRLRKGLLIMLVEAFLLLFLLFPLAMEIPIKTTLAVLVATASAVVWIYAIVDGHRLARSLGRDYPLRDSNHWLVYLTLFLLGGLAGPMASGLFIREKFLQAFHIPTSSMAPTLLPGDRALARKDRYLTRDPARGELVVFSDPAHRGLTFVKRVVALPGETVELNGGRLQINGQALPLEPVPDSARDYVEINGDSRYQIRLAPETEMSDFGPVVVPPYHVFVLGDNRNAAKDSRAFGAVATSSLQGRMVFLYWPAESWSRFGGL